MSPYHVESWEQALRVLQQMTPHERKNHFDMRSWGHRTDCGTVACLAGHCYLDPWFQKNRGLNPIWKQMARLNELLIDKDDLEMVFGHLYEDIFLRVLCDHADVVRLVKLKLANLTKAPVCPLGWGMP